MLTVLSYVGNAYTVEFPSLIFLVSTLKGPRLQILLVLFFSRKFWQNEFVRVCIITLLLIYMSIFVLLILKFFVVIKLINLFLSLLPKLKNIFLLMPENPKYNIGLCLSFTWF